MHVWNSIAAWVDALLCKQRTFSSRAARLSLAFSAAYTLWIQLVRQVVGQYPYPVLNKLPHPHGFVALSVIGHIIALVVFAFGRGLARYVLARPVRSGVQTRRTSRAKAA
jgi:hypothetical protein